MTGRLIADAHVHFHACFPLDAFFDAAWSNLSSHARPAEPFLGYLLLAESLGDDWFGRWRSGSGEGGAAWRFRPTAEAAALLAQGGGGRRLVVVAGRQIATREGLEVLALGTRSEIRDGLPLGDAVRSALDSAALVGIPWGFGKWWFGRGALVAAAAERWADAGLFLGDNGGRWSLAPAPRLLRAAPRLGVRILPGSDPLPFPRHAARAGRLGFVVEGRPDPRAPVAALAAALANADARPVGRHRSLFPFLRDQVLMQHRKRRLRSAARGVADAPGRDHHDRVPDRSYLP